MPYPLLEHVELREHRGRQVLERNSEREGEGGRTLLRNRIVDVLTNHCELQIESNSMRASCIWFESRSSTRNCCGRRREGEEGRSEFGKVS